MKRRQRDGFRCLEPPTLSLLSPRDFICNRISYFRYRTKGRVLQKTNLPPPKNKTNRSRSSFRNPILIPNGAVYHKWPVRVFAEIIKRCISDNALSFSDSKVKQTNKRCVPSVRNETGLWNSSYF